MSSLGLRMSGTSKKFISYGLAIVGILLLVSVTISSSSMIRPRAVPGGYASTPIHSVQVTEDLLQGGVIAGKIENATVKAELGRAAWKLLHTTMAKFPDAPTADEQTALTSYVHLFARLYPCGECAGHFRKILQEFPPQVSSRSAAAIWACRVHNEVNVSLKKANFDCSKIGDFYDCGCGDETTSTMAAAKKGRIDVRAERGD